jgi:hypothetical protein
VACIKTRGPKNATRYYASCDVGRSYGGPLKEDKHGGKTKWAPAPDDAEAILGIHLKIRKLHGAKADDLAFPFVPAKSQNRRRPSTWTGYRKEYVEARWNDALRPVASVSPGTKRRDTRSSAARSRLVPHLMRCQRQSVIRRRR